LPSGATTIAVLKPKPAVLGFFVERGVDVHTGLRAIRGGELVGRPARSFLRLGSDIFRPRRVDAK